MKINLHNKINILAITGALMFASYSNANALSLTSSGGGGGRTEGMTVSGCQNACNKSPPAIFVTYSHKSGPTTRKEEFPDEGTPSVGRSERQKLCEKAYQVCMDAYLGSSSQGSKIKNPSQP